MTLDQPPSTAKTQERVVLDYDLTDDEHVASLSHLAHRQRVRMVWYVVTGLALVGAIFTDIPDDPTVFRLALAIMGASFVIAGLALPHLWRDRMKKVLAQTPDAGLSRVTFDESGVRAETPVVEELLRWMAFTHYTIRERPQMLVLFRGQYQPSPVPRRACADEAQWQTLLELVAHHVARDRPAGSAFPVVQSPPRETRDSPLTPPPGAP